MISIQQLSVRFGSITALTDVTCDIGRGRITAVIGPNAAGKSTLLRCIAGALKPTDGIVQFEKRPVHRIAPHSLAQQLAFVAQRPAVAASFTVEEIVALGRYALAPDTVAVHRAMQRMDIADLAHRVVPTLSVGQQQRVAVARALAQHQIGGVMVLDEPSAALDMKHALHLMQELRSLADAGATVVLSVHDLTMAAAIAEHVVLLHDGRLVDHGPVAKVLTAEALEQVFEVAFEWVERPDGSRNLIPCLPNADGKQERSGR